MKKQYGIIISLVGAFILAVFLLSYFKGESFYKTGINLAIVLVVSNIILLIVNKIKGRKEVANGHEKTVINILTYFGHAVVITLIILCVWAGTSYLRDAAVKEYVGLYLTAAILFISESVSLKKKIEKHKNKTGTNK